MSSHKLSIHIFIAVAVLLGAKLGITLWPMASTTDVAIYSEPTIEQAVSTSMPAMAIQPREKLTVDQSLALIEAYIIPQAEAASSDSKASPSQPYEDETLNSLRSYKEELDARSKKLDEKEKSISEAEEQVKRRITELEQLEASIKQRLKDEQNIKSKKVKRLTAVFEGMKPDKAAPVVENMELATVIKVFLLMDEKKVGKILSFLPPSKAVAISQALTSQISTVK